MKRASYIIGIDEVGRGPLAGPVAVAAVALPMELRIMNYELGKLRDSKKLSERQRESWFRWLKAQCHKPYAISHKPIYYATASVYPKVIDRINISRAANLAATRAFKRLMENSKWHMVKVFLDGGLYLSKTISPKLYAIRTVVRGDEKYNAIKLASIVAKVKRDQLLKRYHKKYPQYGFAEHKGYGTKAHLAAIRKYGLCKIHRLTFLKNYLNIE